MPFYKKREYFVESFFSVANQSYKNIEIIFVDDESKDNSYKIAKMFKNVKVFKKKKKKI